MTIDAVRDGTTNGVVSARNNVPVSIAEVGLAGVPVPAAPATVDIPCRSDLVRVDGHPVPVQIVGPSSDARSGLSVESCEGALALGKGSNTLRAEKGLDTGIDLDRLVLSSDAEGQGTAVTTLGTPLDQSGAQVRVTGSSPDSYDLKVQTDGKPFWLVLGESHSDGWEAKAAGTSLGTPQLVNGFANGWLVRPKGPGTIAIALQFAPQRYVWFGIGLSIVAILACIALGGDHEPSPPNQCVGGGHARVVVAGQVRGPRTVGGRGCRPCHRYCGRCRTRVALVDRDPRRRCDPRRVARVAGGRMLLTAGAPLALALGKLLDTTAARLARDRAARRRRGRGVATNAECGPSGSSWRTCRRPRRGAERSHRGVTRPTRSRR